MNPNPRRSPAAALDMPLLDLDAFDLGEIPAHLLDERTVRRLDALPLAQRGGRLFVAIADPANAGALDAVAAATGLEAAPVLVDRRKLAAAIGSYRSAGHESLLAALATDHADEADGGGDAADGAPGGGAPGGADEAPVVRFIHQTLLDAVDKSASDIHFEPYENSYRVRLRIDGVLREARRPPAQFRRRFAARLKVMGRMDVTERRTPQDGRIEIAAGQRRIDFRVSTLPTIHGEKVALRVLPRESARLGIGDIGFAPEQKRLYLDALAKPQGMVLVTGPTGSGKTATVYAGLDLLNAEHRNIGTVEDPVEIDIEGINQVQVNPRAGLDFATALRAFLRQDPDVVMVGEVRDLETAETAIKAAQTGHLVLSTLHTNSAAETLTRLRTMGVPAYNLATSISLVIAQRLARLLCPHCRRPADLPPEILRTEGLGDAASGAAPALFEASDGGCGACDGGYRGRTGIYEMLPLSPQLQRLILTEGDSLALAEKARRLGYRDLRRAGLDLARRGLTSLREINRVAAAR